MLFYGPSSNAIATIKSLSKVFVNTTQSIFTVLFLLDWKIAVNQNYETEADNEYVILGNTALVKCEIPSFVSDLIQVVGWEDNMGNIFTNDLGTK